MQFFFFLQSGPSLPQQNTHGVSSVGLVLMIIPILMVIIGMVLGFHALKDIRLAEGRLGGAVTATLAAGLHPALYIVLLCGGGLLMLAEEVLPHERARSDVWPVAGGTIGLWLSFLMMRGMWRQATGWVRPAAQETGTNRLTMAAIVLTIAGAALMLVTITVRRSPSTWQVGLPFLDLVILVAGLICGVLSWREPASKVCAWISGSLFVIMVLLVAA